MGNVTFCQKLLFVWDVIDLEYGVHPVSTCISCDSDMIFYALQSPLTYFPHFHSAIMYVHIHSHIHRPVHGSFDGLYSICVPVNLLTTQQQFPTDHNAGRNKNPAVSGIEFRIF